jgi:hypothetical protein
MGHRRRTYFLTAPGGGGSTGTGTVDWSPVNLTGANLVQDPLGALASVTYGIPMSFTTNNVDPGNIRGAGAPFNPDCPLWEWEIANPVDFVANSQVLVQLKLTATANDAYFIYLGVYDNTVGTNSGLYGSIRVDTGATGAGLMGSAPSNGTVAASIVASGGNLCMASNFDANLSRPRDVLVRSTSNTGPAYGEQGNAGSSPGNFAGTNLRGFFAIGATGVMAAGTFSGIELRYAVASAFV